MLAPWVYGTTARTRKSHINTVRNTWGMRWTRWNACGSLPTGFTWDDYKAVMEIEARYGLQRTEVLLHWTEGVENTVSAAELAVIKARADLLFGGDNAVDSQQIRGLTMAYGRNSGDLRIANFAADFAGEIWERLGAYSPRASAGNGPEGTANDKTYTQNSIYHEGFDVNPRPGPYCSDQLATLTTAVKAARPGGTGAPGNYGNDIDAAAEAEWGGDWLDGGMFVYAFDDGRIDFTGPIHPTVVELGVSSSLGPKWRRGLQAATGLVSSMILGAGYDDVEIALHSPVRGDLWPEDPWKASAGQTEWDGFMLANPQAVKFVPLVTKNTAAA